jgi:antitoxin PrlF
MPFMLIYGVNGEYVMNSLKAKATVSESGRLSIPADMRRAMGLEKGGVVQLEMIDGKLEVLTNREFVKRIQQMAREDGWHKAGSVDDFIMWKRQEALRETEKLK